MTEMQIICDNERYYMRVDLDPPALGIRQAWYKVRFGMDFSDLINLCSTHSIPLISTAFL